MVGVLAQILVAVSSTYMIVIRDMVFDYVDLVGRKMTVKERSERHKTSRELNIDAAKDDVKKQPVPFGLRCKRMWRFFVTKKAPKSIIQAK